MDTPPDTVAVCYALPSSANVDEPSSTVLDRCDMAQQAPELGFAACHAVFKTYELLERILIHVGTTPPDGTKTLLFCQKVNENFKSVINRSKILQQALFFEPAPVDGKRFGIDGVNPLLLAKPDGYGTAAPLMFIHVREPERSIGSDRYHALDTIRERGWMPCGTEITRDRMLHVHEALLCDVVGVRSSVGPASEEEMMHIFGRWGVKGYPPAEPCGDDGRSGSGCGSDLCGGWYCEPD